MRQRNLIQLAIIILALPAVSASGQVIWSEDFETSTVGQAPQGWTAYDGGAPNGNWTVVADGSKALDQSNSSALDSWCVPDSGPFLSTLCLQAKVKITSIAEQAAVDILARMDNGDIHFGYGAFAVGDEAIYIYDDFAGTVLATIEYSLEIDKWYFFKACLCGGAVKLKVWDAEDPEPDEYQLESTTAYTSPGEIGLRTTGASARFDDIQVYGACGAVPGLSDWGLVALVVLMLVTAAATIRRERLHRSGAR